MGLLDQFQDGQKHEINEQTYDYFLGGLPPVRPLAVDESAENMNLKAQW